MIYRSTIWSGIFYAFIDSNVTSPVPIWLNDKKKFKSGENVVLGTNGGSNESVNYIPQEKVIKDDVDLDGVVDVFDMCIARKGATNGFTNTLSFDAANVDENAKVAGNDPKQIQDFILGKIKKFKKAT